MIRKWYSIGFCAILFLVCILNILTPSRSFSDNENRTLALFPAISAQSIFSGEFMTEFETYANDQFPMRDFWVSLKANAERAIGKKENNGVLFAKNGYLITKSSPVNSSLLNATLSSIQKLDALNEFNISLALIPTQAEILKEYLPKNTYVPVQPEILQATQNALFHTNVSVIDPTQALEQHKDQYLYYRTDHHQTSLGSYYAYREIITALGEAPLPLEAFHQKELSDNFFGTTWSKATFFHTMPDTITAFEPKNPVAFHVNYLDTGEEAESLYSLDKLQTKDKYSVFLDGNHAILTIESGNKNGKSLAVFKDSYAHSILPFLANHYQTIHVIDPRYYNLDPVSYLRENNLTDVLLIYNTPNFAEDTNIVKLGAFIH